MKTKRHSPCYGLYSKWDHFWQETGIDALSHAGKAQNAPVRRTIWIVVFLIFSAFTLQSVVKVVQEYLEYPTTTSMSIKLASWVNLNNITLVYL